MKPAEFLRERGLSFYQRFISLKGPAAGIAMGFSLGVFIAFSPLLGFHTFLLVVLTPVLRANFTASLLVSWICNPFTIPFILFADLKTGQFLLGYEMAEFPWGETLTLEKLLEFFWSLMYPMLIGSILIGGMAAVAVYWPVKMYVVRSRAKNGAEAVGVPEGEGEGS